MSRMLPIPLTHRVITDRDNDFYLKWDKLSETDETVRAYLDEWVFGVKDRHEYWEKLGPETHQRLKVASRASEPINYGDY